MIRITGGKVYDPANGIAGEVKDIWYENGVICEAGEAGEVIDAGGCAVMAGGIDIHSHLAGEPLEFLREDGSGLIPTVPVIGEEYGRMGYTTVVNAAMPAFSARKTILEEKAIGGLDALNLTWVGENPALMQLIEKGSDEELDNYLAWLLTVSAGYGLKLVNPLRGQEGFRHLTKRLIEANERLALPHPLHLHHPFLAAPGAYEELIRTMDLAEGLPLHFAHLQFYSYMKNEDGDTVSSAALLAKAINERPNITADVGAVVFGEAAAVSCDTNIVDTLASGKRKGARLLWELDGGMGVVPLAYKAANRMNATQFLAGLELMLLIDDPEQIFLTTDHPNGGPYTAYPYLTALLMDKGFRDDEVKKLSPKAVAASDILSIDREYSLDEIARMTRSGPAKRLGLPDAGHLGAGARGGIAIYKEAADKAAMFSDVSCLLKGADRVVAAPEKAYDKAYVRGIMQPFMDVDFEEAFPDEAFLTGNGVEKEETK